MTALAILAAGYGLIAWTLGTMIVYDARPRAVLPLLVALSGATLAAAIWAGVR